MLWRAAARWAHHGQRVEGLHVLRTSWLRLVLFGYWCAAYLWRRALFGTRYIAIVGSVGKTTSKELVAGCLVTRWPTLKTRANQNGAWGVPRTLLRSRPWHRAVVVETGAWEPGDIAAQGGLIKPDVAVVLRIAMEHRSSFHTLDAIAGEKASIVQTVRRGGTVWLNGDDPMVASIQIPGDLRRRVFGSSPSFDLWASQVRSVWPKRLTFTAHAGDEAVSVSTQLVGVHWLPSVLAALSVAVEWGMGLAEAGRAVSAIPPMVARMQPVELSTGAVVIRDDYKGGVDTLRPGLDVLRAAPPGRRWLVNAGVDESRRSDGDRMKLAAREAPGAVDFAVFIGDHADDACQRAIRDGIPEDHVFGALNAQQAADIVRRETRRGDLILLKGSGHSHLARIYFAQEEGRFGRVTCWRNDCRKRMLCDQCPKLHGKAPTASDRPAR